MFFFFFDAFIESVIHILKKAGIDNSNEFYDDNKKSLTNDFDYSGILNNELYGIDIKSYSSVKASLTSISKAAKELSTKATKFEGSINLALIVSSVLETTERKQLQITYPEVYFVDISNLLYIVQNDEELNNNLVSSLSYTIDDIEPIEGPIELSWFLHSNYTKNLIEEMKLCQSGKHLFRKYEELCYSLLKNAFSSDLALWKKQQRSNAEIYRFDLICRIKDDNKKTFWSIIEDYFHSKYVVFEFKNYKGKVTQKEIYTTEKYLYAKALRCVAIIIAANGYDTNARWAAKGAFRENGKLILLLDSNNLIEMNQMKMENKDPSMFLLNCLDNLLLELEK